MGAANDKSTFVPNDREDASAFAFAISYFRFASKIEGDCLYAICKQSSREIARWLKPVDTVIETMISASDRQIQILLITKCFDRVFTSGLASGIITETNTGGNADAEREYHGKRGNDRAPIRIRRDGLRHRIADGKPHNATGHR